MNTHRNYICTNALKSFSKALSIICKCSGFVRPCTLVLMYNQIKDVLQKNHFYTFNLNMHCHENCMHPCSVYKDIFVFNCFHFFICLFGNIIFILSWFWVLFNVHASIVDIYKTSPIIWKKFQVLSLGLSCKLLAFRKVKSTLILLYNL